MPADGAFTAQDAAEGTSLVLGQVNQGVSWLLAKGLIAERGRETQTAYEITELGRAWLEQGSPHRRMISYLAEHGPSVMTDLTQNIKGLEQAEAGSAYGLLLKEGALSMDEQKRICAVQHDPPLLLRLEALLAKAASAALSAPTEAGAEAEADVQLLEQFSKKRGAAAAPFKKTERDIVRYERTEAGGRWAKAAQEAGVTGAEVNALTPAMLKEGSWKQKTFRSYNVALPPARVPLGRAHPYAQFLRAVKDKLVGLGFTEFDGSLVETEFWNSDALFMPQFHAARDIHDVYYVDEPKYAKDLPQPHLDNVAKEHEAGGISGSRGWNYSFDKNFTKRLILRSQGTALSAKALPTASVPGKYFGVLRVFRHDQVDATHLSDFYQTEGIILGDDVSLKTLLGLLKIFAEEFAQAEEVKYVPGYFPFTEPSVEVHIKHPRIGWMELGGSGIFRPEVTRPLGVTTKVAAWGIGVDRMATMQMNINDLRDLFSFDLEQTIARKGARL